MQEVLGDKIEDISTILTLLAPTDSAFEALAETLETTVEDLLKIPVIKKIILYHIIPALKEFAEFAIGDVIETLLQGELGIKVSVVLHPHERSAPACICRPARRQCMQVQVQVVLPAAIMLRPAITGSLKSSQPLYMCAELPVHQ